MTSVSDWMEWLTEEAREQGVLWGEEEITVAKKADNENVIGGVPEYDWKYDPDAFCKNLSKRREPTTPDFKERNLERHIPVFVYGTLKRGGHFHDALEGLPYLGSATTSQPHWDLRTQHDGYFPIMLKSNSGGDCFLGKVRGEVYVVDPLTLLRLDKIEGNGRMYLRQKVFVALHDQKYKTKDGWVAPTIHVWAYIGMPEYWKGQAMVRCPWEKIGDGKYLKFPVSGDSWSSKH